MSGMFVADDLTAWLVGFLADSGWRWFATAVRGTPQQRALEEAATAAVQRAVAEFLPPESDQAVRLASEINKIFSARASIGGEEQDSLLETMRTGIAAQLSALDYSAFPELRHDALSQRLNYHLERQIKVRGSRGGPLTPLSMQLNFDALDDHVSEALRRGVGDENEFRTAASLWCSQIQSRCSFDFLEESGRSLFSSLVDSPRSVVITARAGAGKSTLAAHVVRCLLRDPQSRPMLLTIEDLRGGQDVIRQKAGVTTTVDLARAAEALRYIGHVPMFVIDGLDSMIGDLGIDRARALLQDLAETGCLLVTCRTEIWEQRFADLRLEPNPLDLPGESFVRAVLEDRTPGMPYVPVLSTPIYLDIALRQSGQTIVPPKTETELLGLLWNSYCKPPGGLSSARPDFEIVLDELAKHQLAAMSYEVPASELADAIEARGGRLADLLALEEAGNLWRRDENLRIGHDLLDAFNMGRFLTSGDDAVRYRREVCQRIGDGVAWQVLALAAQIAHDKKDARVLREIFTEFLMILDRKKLSELWMTRAWAVTYVLLDKITVFMPFVLEVLGGAQPADSDPERAGSSLGPDPSVTQEAASSLVSAFAGLKDWQAGLPELAIPVLSGGLERWRLRKRFVEALSKYKHPAALQTLLGFARSLMAEELDTALLPEVAEAIGAIGRDFVGQQRQDCLDVLGELARYPVLDQRARREVIISMNELAGRTVEPVPAVEEAEIITYLDPRDEANRSYSDWRVVEQYASYAYDRIKAGQITEALVLALLDAFAHQALRVRVSIARCLGEIDDSRARTALLAEMLKPGLALETMHACIDALRVQIERASEPVSRTMRRWLVLDAATEASGLSARGLTNLTASTAGAANDLLLTAGAMELAHADPQGSPAAAVAMLPMSSAPIADWIRDLASPEDLAKVGRSREAKYRVTSTPAVHDRILNVGLTATTWEESASFHSAVLRQASALRQNVDKIVSGWISGATTFPGLASVHSIVVTKDAKVIKTRRATETLYSAGKWSISFEEQVTGVDFDDDQFDAVTAAALRGFDEELGLPATTCRPTVMSALLEFSIINVAFAVLLETSLLSNDFPHHVQNGEEIKEVRSFDLSSQQLGTEAENQDLHPTSRIRLGILSRRNGWPLP
jgi:hypothetical protein